MTEYFWYAGSVHNVLKFKIENGFVFDVHMAEVECLHF